MPRETVLAKHQPTAEPGLHLGEYRRELEGNGGSLDLSASTRRSAFPTDNPRLLTLVTEVFPVPAAAIPKLHAWGLDLRGGDAATIGGKLSYRLRKVLGGIGCGQAGAS